MIKKLITIEIYYRMFTKLIRPIRSKKLYLNLPKSDTSLRKIITKIKEFINPTECRFRTPVTKLEKNIGICALCASVPSYSVYEIAEPIIAATFVTAICGSVFMIGYIAVELTTI
uniref:Uncharacterized protein n=1 Tax=viral metagenome TaxID=1070528 RepID=A0A6C0C9J2_9ZZZZ